MDLSAPTFPPTTKELSTGLQQQHSDQLVAREDQASNRHSLNVKQANTTTRATGAKTVLSSPSTAPTDAGVQQARHPETDVLEIDDLSDLYIVHEQQLARCRCQKAPPSTKAQQTDPAGIELSTFESSKALNSVVLEVEGSGKQASTSADKCKAAPNGATKGNEQVQRSSATNLASERVNTGKQKSVLEVEGSGKQASTSADKCKTAPIGAAKGNEQVQRSSATNLASDRANTGKQKGELLPDGPVRHFGGSVLPKPGAQVATAPVRDGRKQVATAPVRDGRKQVATVPVRDKRRQKTRKKCSSSARFDCVNIYDSSTLAPFPLLSLDWTIFVLPEVDEKIYTNTCTSLQVQISPLTTGTRKSKVLERSLARFRNEDAVGRSSGSTVLRLNYLAKTLLPAVLCYLYSESAKLPLISHTAITFYHLACVLQIDQMREDVRRFMSTDFAFHTIADYVKVAIYVRETPILRELSSNFVAKARSVCAETPVSITPSRCQMLFDACNKVLMVDADQSRCASLLVAKLCEMCPDRLATKDFLELTKPDFLPVIDASAAERLLAMEARCVPDDGEITILQIRCSVCLHSAGMEHPVVHKLQVALGLRRVENAIPEMRDARLDVNAAGTDEPLSKKSRV